MVPKPPPGVGGPALPKPPPGVATAGGPAIPAPPTGNPLVAAAAKPAATPAAAKPVESEAAMDSKLVSEIEGSVKEWRQKLMGLLKAQDFAEFNRVKNQVATLLEWRRQLLDKSSKQHDWVRHQVIRLIESRRQMEQAFTMPRTADDSVATTTNSTISDLHEKHKDMAQRMVDGAKLPDSVYEQYRAEEEGGQRQRKAASGTLGDEEGDGGGATANLYVNVKAAIFSSPDPVQIVFSLWVRNEGYSGGGAGRSGRSASVAGASPAADPRASTSPPMPGASDETAGGVDTGEFTQVSEEFLVGLTNKGFPEDPDLFDKLCTVFVDASRSKIREHLFLVCRIYRIGTLNPDPKGKVNLAQGAKSIGDVTDSQVIFRRPFGLGVMDLANFDVHQYTHGEEKEHTIMLYKTCNTEGYGFPELHFNLMRNGNNAQEGIAESIPQCTGVVVGLGVFDGHISELMKFETKKPFDERKDLKLTRRAMDKTMEIGRNDLYLTLVSGKFSQDGKKSAKNIEVKMTVMSEAGQGVPCLNKGTGRQSVIPSDTYRSCVYYHSNNPTIMETVRMTIPDGDLFEKSHLFFLISHCKDDKKTARLSSSFCFLPLAADANGVAIPGGDHFLKGYKLLPGMDKGKFSPTYLTADPSKLVEHKVKALIGNSTSTEELIVHARLVSTKKTQIKELHELINWRKINDPTALAATFEKLIRNNWNDVVKM